MTKLKKLFSIILCLILVVSITACAKAPAEPGTKAAAKVPNQTTYPLTIKDSYDRDVVISKEPKTIVSVAPNITETVFALGKSSELIGRTDFDTYPNEVKNIQSIGGLQNPNVEKIAELKPDIVIASAFFPKEVVTKLEELKIPVIVLYGPDSFDGAYDTINKVGQILNAGDKANSIVAGMKKKVVDVEAKVKGLPTPSVYYVVSFGKAGDFTAGAETFVGKMLEMAGGKNAASDTKDWNYSVEKLVEKNPDLLICSKYFNTKANIKIATGYKDLTAVKNDKLYEIDNNLVDIQGPRLADGLEALAKIIHPEVYK
jgi:iron complex transport system substrate-binding protein